MSSSLVVARSYETTRSKPTDSSRVSVGVCAVQRQPTRRSASYEASATPA
ncbi:hypothetical protein [Streptomyces sp. ZAF1911]